MEPSSAATLAQLHKRAWLARLDVPSGQRAFAEVVLDWMGEVESQLRALREPPPKPDRVWTDEERAAIAACPTPVYHETHRYCPSCPWTEEFAA